VAYLEYQVRTKNQQIRQTLEDMKPRPLWVKINRDWNPFVFVRDWITNLEGSLIGRQGGLSLVSRIGETIEQAALGKPTAEPILRTVRELKEIPGEFLRQETAERNLADMMADPRWKLFVLAKGHLSSITGEGPLSGREEFSLSRLGWKLPVMRHFNRAGTMFLLRVRFDQFKAGIATLTVNGEPTINEARIIANMANQATGRGYEGAGVFGEAASVMFSAQYFTSRFKLLFGMPIYGDLLGSNSIKDAGRARRLVAREYGRIALGFAAAYAMAYAAGADIERDLRSSAGWTWRWGRHYVDPLLGFKQFLVLAARVGTGEKKKFATDEIQVLRGEGKKLATGDMMDVLTNFGVSKLAPFPVFALNMIRGEDVNHRPVTLAGELLKFKNPITYTDIYHAMEEDNIPEDVMVSALAWLGAGLITYQPEENPRASTKPRRRQ